ncbi:MAG TPA: VIT family protein [Marinagarivorans sp.]
MVHSETHKSHRSGWLRAAVLGANDGLVSTASLIIGVAAAGAEHSDILLAGFAGLVAGAMSMAAGEYVSVSSQADTEKADLALEVRSLENDFESEKKELAEIYQKRGLSAGLAEQVAEQLMAHDALGAHARDDIGITEITGANPLQAAASSALAFTIGACLPLTVAIYLNGYPVALGVAFSCLIFLAFLGATAAKIGGASPLKGALRVTFWGGAAMLATAIVGQIFGVVA